MTATESWKRERGKFITEIAKLKLALRRSRSLAKSWEVKAQQADRRWKAHIALQEGIQHERVGLPIGGKCPPRSYSPTIRITCD
jgi:hypothetical protein